MAVDGAAAVSRSLWLEMLGCSVRHYDAGGVATRVLEAGTGEPVVLLHGVSGHAESWARNILPLAGRYRVLAVDMVGHGLTDKPDRPYLLPAFVDHLRAVMAAAGVRGAHLVGQSLGGWVAAWLALEHPEEVRTLTLVTSAGLKVNLGTEGMAELQSQVRSVTQKALGAPTREGVRARLEWLMHRAETVTDELVELRYQMFTRPDSRRTMARMVDDVTGEANLDFALTEDRLRRLDVPALVLWSRHNPTTPWTEGEAAAGVMPRGRFVLMEDCAHWPQFEDPERFNAELLGFLSEHHPGTSSPASVERIDRTEVGLDGGESGRMPQGGLRRYRSFVADSARWEGFVFRPGDIVISTPPKCGTTWTQMICALLIFQQPEFGQSLDLISPWLEMLTRDRDAVFEALAAQEHRRFIKAHTPLDGLPWDDRVTYICVGRDPRDVGLSFGNHMANLDFPVLLGAREAAVGLDDLAELLPEGPPVIPDSEVERFRQWVDDPTPPTAGIGTLAATMHHLATFWEARDRPNVVLLHYGELQADLEQQMRSLATALGIEVPPDLWPELVQAARFERMRERADEIVPDSTHGIWLDNQRFFNRGTSQWSTLLGDDDLRRYEARVAELAEPDLLAWVHQRPDAHVAREAEPEGLPTDRLKA